MHRKEKISRHLATENITRRGYGLQGIAERSSRTCHPIIESYHDKGELLLIISVMLTLQLH
jgi:hypothetical protein